MKGQGGEGRRDGALAEGPGALRLPARLVVVCLIAASVAAAWSLAGASRSASSGSRPTHRAAASANGLLWHDEFSGPAGSPPAGARWTLESGFRDGMLQQYTRRPDNVSLDGAGHLVITARRVGAGTYTSGAIQTSGRFQTQYGRLEARIELPSGAGLWPAFWALGSDFDRVGWPQSGEIDVMENLGSDPFKITGSVHGPSRGPHGYALHFDDYSSLSLANGFHTYAVVWRPNRITFTLDGVPYSTVTPASLSGQQKWVFDRPFFLLLDLAVGGGGGSPSSTRFPARMLVDWVRVYR